MRGIVEAAALVDPWLSGAEKLGYKVITKSYKGNAKVV
jgi:hypothetical protein